MSAAAYHTPPTGILTLDGAPLRQLTLDPTKDYQPMP